MGHNLYNVQICKLVKCTNLVCTVISIPETGWATWFDVGISKKMGGVRAIFLVLPMDFVLSGGIPDMCIRSIDQIHTKSLLSWSLKFKQEKFSAIPHCQNPLKSVHMSSLMIIFIVGNGILSLPKHQYNYIKRLVSCPASPESTKKEVRRGLDKCSRVHICHEKWCTHSTVCCIYPYQIYNCSQFFFFYLLYAHSPLACKQ